MPDWRQIRRALALLFVLAILLSTLVPGSAGLALCVVVSFAAIGVPVSVPGRRIYSFIPHSRSWPVLSAAGLRAPPQS